MSSDIPENIKCPYIVTFDLDLEHNPNGDTSGDHCVNWSLARNGPFSWGSSVPRQTTDAHSL